MEITELFARKLAEIGPDYRRAAEIAAERLKHVKPFLETVIQPMQAALNAITTLLQATAAQKT